MNPSVYSNPDFEVVKLTTDPMQSARKDIFTNILARNLWCCYKRNHIISDRGIIFLDMICREIIEDKITFNSKDAFDFLNNFIRDMDSVEFSRTPEDSRKEWVAKTLPFLTGEKWIKIEVDLKK